MNRIHPSDASFAGGGGAPPLYWKLPSLHPVVNLYKKSVLLRFRKIRKSDHYIRGFGMFNWPLASDTSVLTGQILVKIDIREFLENMSRKSKICQNPTRIKGIPHEHLYTYLTFRNLASYI
jgi:hypothetical protein